MARARDASDQSRLKQSALSAGTQRPDRKTSKALPGFLLASMLVLMVGGPATTAFGGDAIPAPTCAAEDRSAFDLIEERSEVIGSATKQVLEAVRKFVQARNLCASRQEGQGIALYHNAMNTALGFDTPAVSTIAQITSAAAVWVPAADRRK